MTSQPEDRMRIGDLSPGDIALLKDVAEAAAEKAIANVFTRMGLDANDPIASQELFTALRVIAASSDDPEAKADRAWVRLTRARMQGAVGKMIYTTLGLCIVAAGHALWTGVKALLAVAPIILIVVLISSKAFGHAHWIRDGKYLDPVTGHHCCNEHDCKPLSAAEILTVIRNEDGSMTVQGFRFQKRQQHKSEDGLWYRCANRCLFKPVEG